MIRVERADYPEPCGHASVRQCRAKGPDSRGGFWHPRRRWHLWDEQANDYAAGTGPHQFTRSGEAHAHLRQILDGDSKEASGE